MLKSISVGAAFAVGSVLFASVAFADVSVNVDGSTYVSHHHRHHAVALAQIQSKHSHVYYNGSYAYVARDNGATVVHAYPGVDVYVSAGGGVSVNVGY